MPSLGAVVVAAEVAASDEEADSHCFRFLYPDVVLVGVGVGPRPLGHMQLVEAEASAVDSLHPLPLLDSGVAGEGMDNNHSKVEDTDTDKQGRDRQGTGKEQEVGAWSECLPSLVEAAAAWIDHETEPARHRRVLE